MAGVMADLPRLRPAELAACRALLRGGSRSFFVASRLLPGRVRDDAVALYAFCRVADDVIDAPGGGAALGALHQRLVLAYGGRPAPVAADRALAELLGRCDIPLALPAALLDGFGWDAAGRRYGTIDDLLGYAVRVAGSVGVMMALLMGVRAPDALARACDLGVAMQLSNIARDVGEDGRAGRLYLPEAWLREVGIEPEAWLADPRFSPGLGAVVQRVLECAEGLYARAESGIAALPAGCRAGIAAAGLLYREIGREVARRGLDSVSGRAVVSRRRKIALLAQGFFRLVRPGVALPCLAQGQFLIDAVLAMPARPAPEDDGGRLAWVLELFARLERMQRQGAGVHGQV